MKQKLMFLGIICSLLLTGIGCSDTTVKPIEKTKENKSAEVSKPKEHTELNTSNDFDKTKISEQVNKVIDDKFPGGWSVEGTTLKKGSYTENENFKIADEIAKKFPGSMVSIYAGGTRVSNTVEGYNGRYLTYDIPSEVAQAISTGKPVFDDAKLNATNYHKVYLPIKDKENVIGVIGISFKI